MADHVIIGAGSIGTNVARLLVERGESVRIITRGGSGPEHPLIDRVAADASNPSRLTELAHGAKVIYHAANPPSYTSWERLLPPLQTAAIAAAQAGGAVLALTGSMYAYGPQPGGRMHERTPLAAVGHKGRLRRRLWEQALAAGIRTVDVRGSDYIGQGANGIYPLLIRPALDKGRAAWITGHLDMPHTFTVNTDMARALTTLRELCRALDPAYAIVGEEIDVPNPDGLVTDPHLGSTIGSDGYLARRMIERPEIAGHLAVVSPLAQVVEWDTGSYFSGWFLGETPERGTYRNAWGSAFLAVGEALQEG